MSSFDSANKLKSLNEFFRKVQALSTEIKYICWNCGRVFEPEHLGIMKSIRCPYCNARIIVKARTSVVRIIKAL